MKKTLVSLVILVVALVAMIGSVNAATVTTSPAETKKINKGEEVTVTVKTVAGQGIQFDMDYDADSFEYVEDESVVANAETKGKLSVIAFKMSGTMDSVTLKFKALKNLELVTDEKDKKDEKKFLVSNIIVSETDEKEDATATGVLTIVSTPKTQEQEPEPTNPTPAEPTTPEENKQEENKPADNKSEEKPAENTDQKVGTNGEVIKKLPQTGSSVLVGAIALVVIAGIVLVVKNRK